MRSKHKVSDLLRMLLAVIDQALESKQRTKRNKEEMVSFVVLVLMDCLVSTACRLEKELGRGIPFSLR